jgi:hypothetical protein
MVNSDINTAKLLLTVLDDATWKADVARIANGFIARQKDGVWHSTTANMWGGLALEKFSNKFEAVPVAGSTKASLANASAVIDWAKVSRIQANEGTAVGGGVASFGASPKVGDYKNNSGFLQWQKTGDKASLTVTHQGSGKPWLTLQSVAAVPVKEAFSAGYQVSKTITPLEGAVKGKYSRGDVLRIHVEVNATTDMSWVVLTDPIPAGATILGSGLGRDSEIENTRSLTRSFVDSAELAFEERSFEAFRAYYQFVPKGKFSIDYTVRLNSVGEFSMPATRIEAMYAPEIFGVFPNPIIKVERKQ